MKFYLSVLLLLFNSFFCIAQKEVVLTSDSIRVIFIITEDSLVVREKIYVENLSTQTIYIPDIVNRDIYFFSSKTKLYSNFGIMGSILGVPNLSLEVKLIKLLPKKKLDFGIEVVKQENVVNDYFFSFDYIRDVDLKKNDRSVRSQLFLSMEKYFRLHKYVIGNMKGW